MAADRRFVARNLAVEHLGRDDPLGWFEALYAQARSGGGSALIPWADLAPNPSLLSWAESKVASALRGAKVLVVGCGLGDDAVWFAAHGAEVVAFDISPTAIRWCCERFAGGPVAFEVADVLDPPDTWHGRFDLVFEAYTLQVLPQALRRQAFRGMAACMRPGSGRLLVIARGREEADPPGQMPWPLTKTELSKEAVGLQPVGGIEDFLDDEKPPVRRFRALYCASSA